MSSLSIKQRLALLFTVGFVVSGVLVQAIVFWRLDARLSGNFSEERRAAEAAELGLPEGFTVGPETFILPNGQTLAQLLEENEAEFRTETLTELAIWSTVAVAITTGVAALLGRWLAARALEPMEQITNTTRRITASSLDTRLDWAGPDDELASLAETIDDMLSRIEDGVAAQRQFAAMASHELKTPLSIIELESDLALADPASTTTVELAERTGAAATRAHELVSKLLQLARTQSGIDHREPLELWEVVEPAIADQLELADARGIRIDFEPGSGRVLADRTLIDSLAANLIENGIKHNEPGGWLEISTEEEGEGVVLRVENTGPTIDESALVRIAEPFRRGDVNPGNIGHGLGLTIARTIVDRHDGSIELSARPDGGLLAVVRLPGA